MADVVPTDVAFSARERFVLAYLVFGLKVEAKERKRFRRLVRGLKLDEYQGAVGNPNLSYGDFPQVDGASVHAISAEMHEYLSEITKGAWTSGVMALHLADIEDKLEAVAEGKYKLPEMEKPEPGKVVPLNG